MMLFGPKLNQVFASRWKALGWAASIMLSAYCTIPSAQEAKEKAEAPAPEQSSADQSTQSKSPWALDRSR